MAKATWEVNKEHSTIGFTVRHMKISKVSGTFNEFEASVEADPHDLTDADIEFKIEANSIDTRNKGRDDHVRAGDLFETEKDPHLKLRATDGKTKDEDNYDLTAYFTINETPLPVTFDVVIEGTAK